MKGWLCYIKLQVGVNEKIHSLVGDKENVETEMPV